MANMDDIDLTRGRIFSQNMSQVRPTQGTLLHQVRFDLDEILGKGKLLDDFNELFWSWDKKEDSFLISQFFNFHVKDPYDFYTGNCFRCGKSLVIWDTETDLCNECKERRNLGDVRFYKSETKNMKL